MSRIIDNTLVMSSKEAFDEITRILSENQMKPIHKIELEEQIESAINEELGVSDGVVKLANEIEKTIYQLISKGVEKQTFTVDTDFSSVEVDFTHEDFDNQRDANYWMRTNGINKYSQSENKIYFSVATVNGKFDGTSLSDTIQHECHHYFESAKWKKEPFDETYIIRGMNSKNQALSVICSILYFSIEDEIDAFVNGTFASAMSKKTNYQSYKEFIYDNKVSDAYYFLGNAEFLMENINDELYDAAIPFVCEYILGCEKDEAYNLILKIAATAYHYLIVRIGKAFALYRKKLKEYEEQMEDERIKNILKNGDV